MQPSTRGKCALLSYGINDVNLSGLMYLCVFWQGVTVKSQPLSISFTSLTSVFTCPNRNSRCQWQAFQAQHPKINEKLCPTFTMPQASDVSILTRGGPRSGDWMWPFTVLQKEKWGHAKPFMFQSVVLWLFSTKWPLDAPSTSGCYTASTNTEGKQRLRKRHFSTMNRGQCEVELISMYTDVLSRKCKHIVIALHSPQEL